MRLLGRAFLFSLGLLFAIPAGLLALAVGVAVEPAARELVAELGIVGIDAFLWDFWEDGHADLDAAGVIVGVWALSATLLVLPPAFIALVGEVAGLRSFVWYGFGTGLLTAALPWLGRGDWGEGAPLGAEARLTVLLFLTGAAAGLVYWLAAGRSAGGHEPSP